MGRSNQNSEETILDIRNSPQALWNLFSDWVNSDYSNGVCTFKQGFEDKLKSFDKIQRIILTGAGSSYNAAYAGMYFLNSISKIDATAVLPSELLTSYPIKDPDKTLLIVISSSGETEEVIKNGEAFIHLNPTIKLLALTITDSRLWGLIKRFDGKVLDIKAGGEEGKTATKFYINSVMALYLLACYFDNKDKEGRLAYIKNYVINYEKYISCLLKEYECFKNQIALEQSESYELYKDSCCQLYETFCVNFVKFLNKLDEYLKSNQQYYNKPIILVGTHSTYACAKEGRMKILEFVNYPCMHIDSKELKHATINFLNPLPNVIDFSNIPIVFLLPTSENDYENIKDDIENTIDYAFLSILKRQHFDIEDKIQTHVKNCSIEINDALRSICNTYSKHDDIEKEFIRKWRTIIAEVLSKIERDVGNLCEEFRNAYKFFFVCPWHLKETMRWKDYFENDIYEYFLTTQLKVERNKKKNILSSKRREKRDYDDIIIDEFKNILDEKENNNWPKISHLFNDEKKYKLKRIFIENPIISVHRKALFYDDQFVYLKGISQTHYPSEINDVQDFLTYIPFFWIFAYGLSTRLLQNRPSDKTKTPDETMIRKYYSYKPQHIKEFEEHLDYLTKQIGNSERKLITVQKDYDKKINKWIAYGMPSFAVLVFLILSSLFIYIVLKPVSITFKPITIADLGDIISILGFFILVIVSGIWFKVYKWIKRI